MEWYRLVLFFMEYVLGLHGLMHTIIIMLVNCSDLFYLIYPSNIIFGILAHIS
jgi:hypothetical protein